MNFNEKQAREIISRYSLSEKTLRVWKTRGKIPDQYLNGSAIIRQGKVGEREMKRLIEVFSSEKINKKEFLSKVEGINEQGWVDAVRYGSVLDRAQYNTIKVHLNKIRVELKKLVSSTNFEKDFVFFLKNYPELKTSKMFDKKALDIKRGKSSVIDENLYKDRIAVFLLETSL